MEPADSPAIPGTPDLADLGFLAIAVIHHFLALAAFLDSAANLELLVFLDIADSLVQGLALAQFQILNWNWNSRQPSYFTTKLFLIQEQN